MLINTSKNIFKKIKSLIKNPKKHIINNINKNININNTSKNINLKNINIAVK